MTPPEQRPWVSFDTDVVNHILDRNLIRQVRDKLRQYNLCISRTLPDQLDATPDRNRREQLFKTLHQLVLQANEVRMFLEWGDAHLKEYKLFKDGSTSTLETISTSLPWKVVEFLENPTPSGLEQIRLEDKAKKKELKRISLDRINDPELKARWDRFPGQRISMENLKSPASRAALKEVLMEGLHRCGIDKDEAYIDAATSLDVPLHVAQGSLVLYSVAVTRWHAGLQKPKHGDFDDFHVMFGCFFLDFVVSDDPGFRDIFNDASDLLKAKSRAIDLDTWMNIRNDETAQMPAA